jgi:hypothetical protein
VLAAIPGLADLAPVGVRGGVAASVAVGVARPAESTVDFLVGLLSQGILVYAALGAVFAVLFALRGARAVDPVAEHATIGFRLLVLPGATLLWPLLARRWWLAATGRRIVPGERTEVWSPGSERLRARALGAWLVIGPLAAAALAVALVASSEARSARGETSPDAARLPAEQPEATP